jgi:hypothetical protein
MELIACQAFYRFHDSPFNLKGHDQAGIYILSIEQNHTGPASTHFTRYLSTGKPEIFS